MKVHDLTACPGCGGGDWETVATGDPPLRRCRHCRVVFAPRFAEPGEVYTDDYLFGDSEFGLDLSDALFQQYLAHAAAVRLGIIERVTGPGTLLDVGCGTGEVMAVAVERGWRAQGVEPVARSAAYASEVRGLDVRPHTLEESGLPERSFDVVTAFHVLEHMVDGVSFLRLMARWARPGGLVAVEVPNWRSFHRRNAGDRWSGLRPLEHVAHYGPRSLARTMRTAGIRPVRVTTPTFLWDRQSLDQQLDDLGLYRWKGRLDRLGRVGEQKGRPALLPKPAAARALAAVQHAYARAGVGQVVLAVGRVP